MRQCCDAMGVLAGSSAAVRHLLWHRASTDHHGPVFLEVCGVFFCIWLQPFSSLPILTFSFSGLSFPSRIHLQTRASAWQKCQGLNLGCLSQVPATGAWYPAFEQGRVTPIASARQTEAEPDASAAAGAVSSTTCTSPVLGWVLLFGIICLFLFTRKRVLAHEQ